MKKFLKLIIAILLVIVSSAIFAQEAKVVEKSQISEGVTLEHSYTPGEMGSFDRLIVNKDGKPAVIFESEGRKIKEVLPLDTNNDGKLEYLVSMDCGGSGGYYDLTIIKEKENVWNSIWDNTLCLPKIDIKNNDDKSSVQIEYIKNPSESAKTSIMNLTFDNDTVIKKD